MNLNRYFLTENACFKCGRKLKLEGLMLHSTGANNPNLSRYVPLEESKPNNWDQYHPGGREVCVHGFIGKLKDGSIATVQTLPWDMESWHAGKGYGNQHYMSIEICEDGLNDANYFNAVYKEAVELFAYLCEMFHLNPLTQILCHCEGYKKGIASNHSDVMHWFPKFGKSMDTFRNDVKNAMSNKQPVDNAKPTPKPVQNNNVQNGKEYLVKIIASELNVRDGAGTNYKVNTVVHKNEVFTIVEEKMNGDVKWGKLKSGAGWISLNSKYVSTNLSASTNTKPKPVQKKLVVGSKVKIKNAATKYCTGQSIPNSVKNKTYTVKQIGTKKYPNGVLISEIMSWVNKSDLQY